MALPVFLFISFAYIIYGKDERPGVKCQIKAVENESQEHLHAKINFSLTSEQEKERNALIDFYRLANGNQWKSSSDCPWNKSVFHCYWFGIECLNTTWLVQNITLYDNNLTGTIPPSVLLLPELQKLTVSKNSISGNIGAVLPRLPRSNKILQLTLSFNYFWGELPWKNLSTFYALEKLQIAYNEDITGNIPDDFGLNHLQVLSLGQTGITGSLPSGIARCSKLYYLDLEELKLNGDIGKLPPLPRLTILHLRGNNLTGQMSADFGEKAPNLTDLLIQNNKITGKLPNCFDKMPFLETLDVSGNLLDGALPNSLLLHNRVKSIDVSHNRFSHFDKFRTPNLRIIRFAHNPLNFLLDKAITKLSLLKNLEIVDFSGCGLNGTIPLSLWTYFANLMSINFSRNRLAGLLTKPRFEMLDIVFISFADNDLQGDIPLAFSLVASAARFDVRRNEQLRASNSSNPLPKFLEPKSNFWFKERSTDPYSCQQINFKKNNGVFLLDSSYYYKIFCNCSQGFYGHSGNCFLCPKDATCNESLQNSSIQFGKDLYPFTTGRTVAFYDCKQNAFVHKNRCNPSGNCKCWLSHNASNITCNQTCLCATNTGGRLCSECAPSTHVSLLGDCVPCAAVNASLPKVYIVIGCLVLFLFGLWIVKQVRPCGISSKHLNRIRIFMIGFEIVVIVTLAATETIPLFVAEAYFLILFLVIFSQLKLTSLKITFTTIIVFLQIIGTIQSTPLKRNCKFCTFKQLFSLIGLDRVVKVVNFHFGEIACVFPIAYKPLGKLALLGVFPLVLGLLIVLKIAVDYYSHKCQKLSPKEAKKLKKKSLKRAKCNVMLILIVMYFPIVSNALKVAMPCEHELGNRAMKYMKAYPFIECNSSEHWILVVIAAIELAVYGCLIPLVFYVLLQLYGPSKNQNRLNDDDDKDFLSRSDARRKGAKWLRCLHSPYQRAYRKYMGIIFILRRLLVAVVLRVFAGQDGDVEQLVFTTLCVVFVAFSIGVRPYKNATRYNLENYADATGFAVILLTYHMETTNASPTTAILVFVINICYVAGLVTLGIYQLCKARKTRKKRKTLCRLS